MRKALTLRWILGGACVLGLVLIFLFQRIDLAGAWRLATVPLHKFLINRTIRFLLNDLLAIGLIYALFYERKYLVFAVWVQVVGTVLFLLPYFVLKLYFPVYNGPLISYLHRLILNPTLLMLLIPAFYYQRTRTG